MEFVVAVGEFVVAVGVLAWVTWRVPNYSKLKIAFAVRGRVQLQFPHEKWQKKLLQCGGGCTKKPTCSSTRAMVSVGLQ